MARGPALQSALGGVVRVIGIGFVAGVAVAQVACDYASDQVAVGRATGVLRGWDHSTCECEFTDEYAGQRVVSLTCSPLFDGKDGFSGFLHFEQTPLNEIARTSLWSYDGFGGTATMEITDEVDLLKDVEYRAVFIDEAVIPAQDACVDYVGGYYDYYIYTECTPFAGGTLENVRMWCEGAP
jgi:hypothetical protein